MIEEQFKAYIQHVSPLNEEVMNALNACFRKEILKKNEYFVREGAYAQQIAFVASGVVRAFYIDEEGKEYNKQFFMAPAFIGAYTSLLTKTPNRIAQQALTDCELYVADYNLIEELYARYHQFERFGRKIAEHYFLEKEKKELEMGLLEAKDRYLIFQKEFSGIENLIAQRHIASYLGISQTQLSRIRRKLLED